MTSGLYMTHVCVHARTYTHIHKHMCIHTHIHTSMHAHTHARTHMHTHTHVICMGGGVGVPQWPGEGIGVLELELQYCGSPNTGSSNTIWIHWKSIECSSWLSPLSSSISTTFKTVNASCRRSYPQQSLWRLEGEKPQCY